MATLTFAELLKRNPGAKLRWDNFKNSFVLELGIFPDIPEKMKRESYNISQYPFKEYIVEGVPLQLSERIMDGLTG